MEEFVYYNNLFDIYGVLLTEKEQEVFKEYYHENFSLSEIAEDKNISRSAVQKTLKTVLEKLNNYEDKLFVNKRNILLNELIMINDIDTIKNKIKEMLED